MSSKASEAKTPPQALTPIKADRCRACGFTGRFHLRSSRFLPGGRVRVEYLRCPKCGAHATRRVTF